MTDLRVALPWWTPRSVGGSQQAIRGNVKGFLDLGADVDCYIIQKKTDTIPIAERADEYDLIIWPFVDEWLETEAGEGHVHATVGGFGNTAMDADKTTAMFEKADSISFLDPVLAEWYGERCGLPLEASYLALNPPNWSLFEGDYADEWVAECAECGAIGAYGNDGGAGASRAVGALGGHKSHTGHGGAIRHRRFRDGGDGHVLTPKMGNEHKSGELLAQVAADTPDVRYETSVVQAIGGGPANTAGGRLPSNVRVRPGVPYTAMGRRYRDCSLVFNAAEREAGPNVAYEAWLTDRPLVTTPQGLGYHKRLPAVAVEPGEIGVRMDWWFEEVGPYVGAGNGEHYRAAGVEELPGRIRGLLGDEAARADLVEGGRRWLEQLQGYTWRNKAQTIVNIMEETG